MPNFHVARSIDIQVPTETVHQSLTDFTQWPAWSPWLYTEPDAQVDYRGQAGQIGHGYDWRGNMTGEGGMTLTGDDPAQLKMDLTFLKPFKSQAKVGFDIADNGAGGTKLTWLMDSSLPFFMFFMTKSMVAMIGADYERGLRMLKEKLETGTISSSTEVIGQVDMEATDFVGVSAHTSLADIGPSMQNAFNSVKEALDAGQIEASGPPVSIYHKMDIKNAQCSYVAAVPVATHDTVPDGLQSGTITSGRAFKVIHRGSYEHLGNGWATAIAQQRSQKLKPSKQQPAFERYLTDPNETPATEQVTEIYIPLR